MLKPILYRTEMVRATLKGRKTKTRRIIKLQPEYDCYFQTSLEGNVFTIDYNLGSDNPSIICPYGNVGDELWVRETFSQLGNRLIFRADVCSKHDLPAGMKWKPSIFMPFNLSRIRQKIVSIGVERVNDISEADAIAEGIYYEWLDLTTITFSAKNYETGKMQLDFTAKESFETLWNSINGKDSWAKNPWVWVVEFESRLIEKEVI